LRFIPKNFIGENGENICGKRMSYFVLRFQVDAGSGVKQPATVDDIVKICEDLTRIH
jgi:hypothetical protein